MFQLGHLSGSNENVIKRVQGWRFTVSSVYNLYSGHTGRQGVGVAVGLNDFIINDANSVWGAAGSSTTEFIQADFGGFVEVRNQRIMPISDAFEGWGATYLNNARLEYSVDFGANWILDAVLSVPNDSGTTISFGEPGRICTNFRIKHSSSSFLCVGDWAFS